jgi:RNA polymerase sigma factor (sigma-70 family)
MVMTEPPAVSVRSADADLIAAVREGDASAYGILYERHSARAIRLARQIVPAEADADDVVAESFAKILAAIKGGAGPSEAFRPYLLTAVRRVAFDHAKGQRTQVPTDDTELDEAEPFVDQAEASLERSLIAQAFASLPERWQAVLWYTEVEQARPAEVGLLLGISPNSVAALRYRAREGLRQAYLQMHVSHARPECRQVAGLLGGYVRGALSRRDAKLVDDHIGQCADCEATRAELDTINGTMRGVLAPVILGGAAAGYLAHAGRFAAAGRWMAPASKALQRVSWHRTGTQAAAAVAVAAIAVTATLARPHKASPTTTGPLGINPPGSTGPSSHPSGSPGRGDQPGQGNRGRTGRRRVKRRPGIKAGRHGRRPRRPVLGRARRRPLRRRLPQRRRALVPPESRPPRSSGSACR